MEDKTVEIIGEIIGEAEDVEVTKIEKAKAWVRRNGKKIAAGVAICFIGLAGYAIGARTNATDAYYGDDNDGLLEEVLDEEDIPENEDDE